MIKYLIFLPIKLKKLKLIYFSLLPWGAQIAQTEKFMFQNVAYRPTVYKTGTGIYLASAH